MKHSDLQFALAAQRHSSMDDILALVSQPVALLDADGQVAHFNQAFAIELGLPVNAIRGAQFHSLLGDTDRQALEYFAAAQDMSQNGLAQLIVSLKTEADVTKLAHISRFEGADKPPGYLVHLPQPAIDDDPRLRYVKNHLDLGVWDYDTRADRFTASKAWREIRGLPHDAKVGLPNDAWLQDVHPDDRADLTKMLEGQTQGGTKSIAVQYRYRHAEGHWIWILCRSTVMEADAKGHPIKIVGTDTDITPVKERENDLRELTNTLQLAIAASGMGIWEFDPDTSLVHWDDKMLDIYGITDGKNVRSENLWETFIHPDDLADTIAYSEECQRKNTDFNRDYRIVRPNGEIRHIRSLARNVASLESQGRLIGVNIDLSEDYFRTQELERARRKLEHDSRHDALTGLGNRRKSNEETRDLFNDISSDHRYVVMHIDLDYFKRINDTLGHAAGDYVLSIVARKLKNIIGDQGSAFRVGGDEFTVFLRDAPTQEALATMCKTIIAQLSAPTKFEGQDCTIGASIGYAVGQGPPDKPSEIFVNADTALYAAKHAGRSCFVVYSEELEAGQLGNIRRVLLDAMRDDQIICHFQPQFDAVTHEVTGAEALVRWDCPKRGLLTPEQFLPQVIRTGLLPNLDEHVFRCVARQQDHWAALGLIYPRISINISKGRLDSDRLMSQTSAVLRPHHLMTFELLETAFLDNVAPDLAAKFDMLRDLGIRLELDDFGSGRSSIAALQAIKPDGVKIDRSLVAPIATKPNQLKILQSLATIARLEGASVILEGLETDAQLAAIGGLDCDVLQGFALRQPMSADAFQAMLVHKSQTAPNASGNRADSMGRKTQSPAINR